MGGFLKKISSFHARIRRREEISEGGRRKGKKRVAIKWQLSGIFTHSLIKIKFNRCSIASTTTKYEIPYRYYITWQKRFQYFLTTKNKYFICFTSFLSKMRVLKPQKEWIGYSVYIIHFFLWLLQFTKELPVPVREAGGRPSRTYYTSKHAISCDTSEYKKFGSLIQLTQKMDPVPCRPICPVWWRQGLKAEGRPHMPKLEMAIFYVNRGYLLLIPAWLKLSCGG